MVSAGDPAELGKTIAALLAEPERLAKMGQRGLEAVRARYTWGAIAEQMESIYQEIVHGLPKRSR